MWTKNTIDISIFHEYKDNSNIYNNSYIKEYLEKVVKIKMQVSSISLPWLKNRTTEVMDAGTAQSYSDTQAKRDKLKWKKITDYTKNIHTSYKALRNINNITVYEQVSYPQYSWLRVRNSGSTFYVFSIDSPGTIERHWTYHTYGLRPVITK